MGLIGSLVAALLVLLKLTYNRLISQLSLAHAGPIPAVAGLVPPPPGLGDLSQLYLPARAGRRLGNRKRLLKADLDSLLAWALRWVLNRCVICLLF